MKKTYEYRIYPNEEQKGLLAKHFGHCRWMYNYALSKKIGIYKQTGKTLSRYDLQSDIPKLKKDEGTAWLSEVNSQSLQAVLIHLDTAYNKFFTKAGGFPKFKNRKSKQSFEIPQKLTVDFDKNIIDIPKFKEPIKVVFHRRFVGEIRTCHIKRTNTGRYFVTILAEDGNEFPIKPPITQDTSIGIDVGIKSFAVTSEGEKVVNPRYFVNCQRRLGCIQRSFSRKIKLKKKGEPLSSNASKQKLKLQSLHEHVANQRKDFLHKVTTKLIRENQTICIEDLSVKGMMKNRKLSKHIGDVGWGMFFQFLRYKSDWYGKNIISIGRFEPSSKTCSRCGHIKHDLTLKDRDWICPLCSSSHDRDINAAINIRDFSFVNTGSNRNTQKCKSTRYYGIALAASVERAVAIPLEAPGSLVQG
jgi:putative transposase